MKTAKLIKTRREQLGLSQWDLAKRLELSSPQFISNLERGISSLPQDRITEFCTLLKLSRAELIKAMIEDINSEAKARVKRLKLLIK